MPGRDTGIFRHAGGGKRHGVVPLEGLEHSRCVGKAGVVAVEFGDIVGFRNDSRLAAVRHVKAELHGADAVVKGVKIVCRPVLERHDERSGAGHLGLLLLVDRHGNRHLERAALAVRRPVDDFVETGLGASVRLACYDGLRRKLASGRRGEGYESYARRTDLEGRTVLRQHTTERTDGCAERDDLECHLQRRPPDGLLGRSGRRLEKASVGPCLGRRAAHDALLLPPVERKPRRQRAGENAAHRRISVAWTDLKARVHALHELDRQIVRDRVVEVLPEHVDSVRRRLLGVRLGGLRIIPCGYRGEVPYSGACRPDKRGRIVQRGCNLFLCIARVRKVERPVIRSARGNGLSRQLAGGVDRRVGDDCRNRFRGSADADAVEHVFGSKLLGRDPGKRA